MSAFGGIADIDRPTKIFRGRKTVGRRRLPWPDPTPPWRRATRIEKAAWPSSTRAAGGFAAYGNLKAISHDVEITPARSPAAERMRRHRERRRGGLRCLIIELRETEIDALARNGFLKTDARNDLRAIEMALYNFLNAPWVRP